MPISLSMYFTNLDSLAQCQPNYRVIYADPCWSYTNTRVGGSGTSAAQSQYATLSVDQLSALPVRDVAAPDAVLFLWATLPLIEDAFPVMRAWGFEYKTCGFVWVKTNKKAGTPFWGMGSWTRSNTELCLIGVRGRIKSLSHGVHQLIEAPETLYSPVLAHSEKPAIVRDRIVELCGEESDRIELFARGDRADGWDRWGNQAVWQGEQAA